MALNLIAKAPGTFLRFTQPRLATFSRYAKVTYQFLFSLLVRLLFSLILIKKAFFPPYSILFRTHLTFIYSNFVLYKNYVLFHSN